jgi:hypothetical protein
MYQTINQFKKEYQNKFSMIRNKKNNRQWAPNRRWKYGKNILINFKTEDTKELI